jgi:Tfp pilus assembly protein FimT
MELIIVVSLLALIAGFLISGFKNYAAYQQYGQAVNDVAFVLNQTKLKARAAEADQSHGVHFTANSITQFVGDTYVALDPNNVVTAYQLVTLQTGLTGGTDTIVFDRLTGLPSATGTVLVEGISFSASTTIVVSDAGVIE